MSEDQRRSERRQVAWCVDDQAYVFEEDWPKHSMHQLLDAHPKGTRGAAPIGTSNASSPAEVRYESSIAGWDRCLGGGLVKGTRVLLTGDPGTGKCLAASSRVLNPETGATEAIGDIVDRGAPTKVLSLDPTTLRLVPVEVTAFHRNGVQSVFDMVTDLGRTVRATGSHPFLTPEGWRPLASLRSGDRIASPRSLPWFGSGTMPDHEAKLLGYMIGDGSFIDKARLTASEPGIVADIRGIADAFGVELIRYPKKGSQSSEWDFGRTADPTKNPVIAMLQRHGLFGKRSAEKFVPREVFGLSRESLATFLHALYSTDGSVYALPECKVGVSYSTTSRRLASDVQHLMLRFGFVAKIRTKVSRYKDAPYTAYELVMSGVPDVQRFLAVIGLHGREEAKARIAAMPTPTVPSTHRDTVPTGAAFWQRVLDLNRAMPGGLSLKKRTGIQDGFSHGRSDGPISRRSVAHLAECFDDPWLRAIGTGDVYWDEVASVTPAGEEPVFDLSAPPHANFVANDLVVHNSTLTLQALHDYARRGIVCMYVTGEEKTHEVELRFRDLGLMQSRRLILYATESWESARAEIDRWKPRIILIDSLQRIRTSSCRDDPGLQSAAIMAATDRVVELPWHPSMVVIGHINARGEAYGAMANRHDVTVHLHFSPDAMGRSLLRTKKNRHGPRNEVALFEFPPNSKRLREVPDISETLLRDAMGRPGAVAYPAVSKSFARALVIPVEASVSLPKGPNEPRLRNAQGLHDRALDDAIDRLGDAEVKFTDRSVRIQAPLVGEEVVTDANAGLAICLSLIASIERVDFPMLGAFGSFGAAGHVLPDPAADRRLAALAQAGITKAYGPALRGQSVPPGIEYHPVEHLSDFAKTITAEAAILRMRSLAVKAAETKTAGETPSADGSMSPFDPE